MLSNMVCDALENSTLRIGSTIREIVSRYFYDVLLAFLKLSFKFVWPQHFMFDDSQAKNWNDKLYWSFFKIITGVTDGTHVPCPCVVSFNEWARVIFLGIKCWILLIQRTDRNYIVCNDLIHLVRDLLNPTSIKNRWKIGKLSNVLPGSLVFW